MKKCHLKIRASGKMFCTTHRQYLMYVYSDGNGLSFICQVGEDLNLPLVDVFDDLPKPKVVEAGQKYPECFGIGLDDDEKCKTCRFDSKCMEEAEWRTAQATP
jgi:hypothetical protein